MHGGDHQALQQQPGESDEEYALFQEYVGGPRGLEALAREVQPRRFPDLKVLHVMAHLLTLAVLWRWEKRALIHDLLQP